METGSETGREPGRVSRPRQRVTRTFNPLVSGAAALVLATAVLSAPHPASAATTAPVACDPSGETAADAEVAAQLNATLSGTMRGSMDAYRVSCARMVIKATAQLGRPERAAVIALATAIVETGVQNLGEDPGDDALGLYRMRAAWGETTRRLDPVWATQALHSSVLGLYPDRAWLTAPIGEVCQAVQGAASPDAYQGQAADAQTIVNTVWPLVSGPTGTASVFGVLPSGRLTYTAIDAATGTRTSDPVHSARTLGFTPKAMATLNANTLLVTEAGTAGNLYRVDVHDVTDSFQFGRPRLLGSGFTHDLLTYDGTFLYGITGGVLRRYTIAAAKPSLTDITGNTLIGTGFALKTLAATGLSGYLVGTTTAGALLSYKILGADSWTRYQLRASTWQGFDQLLSPGAGVYYGHKPDGSLYRYFDTHPYDGQGADVSGQGAVDTSGWNQVLLSAQPATVTRVPVTG
ncbi:hypothetical protein GCM10009850_028730 [Nonomuraea monospora]|uniref:Uncharacterized protein n=2 Tax=Nonomuraea monospora TaxID=568818 RepID=A0ABN3CFA8_9ACTN